MKLVVAAVVKIVLVHYSKKNLEITIVVEVAAEVAGISKT